MSKENVSNANKTNNITPHAQPTKLIFKPYIARNLLKRGHTIVDIKSYRGNPLQTVFVFADSLKLRDDMQKIIKEHDNKASADATNAQTGGIKTVTPEVAFNMVTVAVEDVNQED